MATTAYQGRGSHLDTSPDGVTFTRIAQLQKFSFGGLKATLENVTNLDTPDVFEEFLPTTVNPSDVSYSGILNPQDTTTNNLSNLLLNQTQTFFKITLTDGSTITFKGYVTDHVPVSVDYAKALTFSGKITITGTVTITPAA